MISISTLKNLLKWPYAEGQTVQMQRLVLVLASHRALVKSA